MVLYLVGFIETMGVDRLTYRSLLGSHPWISDLVYPLFEKKMGTLLGFQ